VETTFIPGKIERCPECDSEKIVFPKSRGSKRKNESGGNQVALLGLWLRRVPERLHGGRDERREATRKRLMNRVLR
jgi:hypothetical protein